MKIITLTQLIVIWIISIFIISCQNEETIKPKPVQPEAAIAQQTEQILVSPPELGERGYSNQWQLLSTPVTESTSPDAFLTAQMLTHSVQWIFGWNSTTEKWKVYPTQVGDTYEPLDAIEPNTAYWFMTRSPIQFQAQGEIQRTFAFKNGWNLAGFSSGNSPVDIESFFTDGVDGSILSSVTSVWQWQVDHWQVWAPAWSNQQIADYGFETATAITPGQGFWVNYSGTNRKAAAESTVEHTYQPGVQTSKAFFAEVRSLGLSLGELSEEMQANGSVDRYSDLAQQFEQELEGLSDLETMSARLTAALKHTSEPIEQQAITKNLVVPDDFQNKAIDIEGITMYLDADYTSSLLQPNNITIDWKLKTSTDQAVGYDFGSYGLSGDNPKRAGAIDFNATILHYLIQSESITYDLGEFSLTDTTASDKQTDVQFALKNLSLVTTGEHAGYNATWATGVISVHYESELNNGSEKVSERNSYVTEVTLSGFLQSPSAKLQGLFSFINTSHSVFGKNAYLDETQPNTFVLKERVVPLFDSITFQGSVENYTSDGESIGMELKIELDPNQEVYFPMVDLVSLSNQDPATIECDSTLHTVTAIGDSVSCLNGVASIERKSGYYSITDTRSNSSDPRFPPTIPVTPSPYSQSDNNRERSHTFRTHESSSTDKLRLKVIETADNHFTGTFHFSGNIDSFLSTQYEGHELKLALSYTDYQAGAIALSLHSTSTSLHFSLPAEVDAQSGKLVSSGDVKFNFQSPNLHFDSTINATSSSGSIVFQNDWLIVDLSDDSLDNFETRDVGTIKNLLGDTIATVEYNKTMGLRAKYTDDSFETLIAIPPQLISGTLTIEGDDSLFEGRYENYRVSGQFTDGKTRHVNADWSVDHESASISYGWLWAPYVDSDTPLTITAQYKGETASKTITVQNH